MNDVTKLPRWAQQRIEVLERNLAAAQAKLDAGPGASNTYLHAWTDTGESVGTPLGTDVSIRFELGNHTHMLAGLTPDGTLQIQLSGRDASSALQVIPRSSNRVEIQPEINHHRGLFAARKVAGYEIGDESWGDTLVEAYMDPDRAIAKLPDA